MKRPLLLMFLCFVLGETGIYMSNWYGIGTAVLLLVVLSFFLYRKRKWIVAFFMPLFFLGGAIVCWDFIAPRQLDACFSTQIEQMTVCGRIAQIEKGEKNNKLYLTQVRYTWMDKTRKREGKLKHKLLVYYPELAGKMGQEVCFLGTLSRLEHASNPGAFDPWLYYKARNVDYTFQALQLQESGKRYNVWRQTLWEIRQKLVVRLQNLAIPPYDGILEAMLLGEKSDLDETTKSLYQEAGIAHIIAISGLHLGMLGTALFGLLRKLGSGYWLAASCSGGIIVTYAVLTGMSGSTRRAMIMLLVVFAGKVIGRGYDMLSAMSLAGFLILLDAPLQFLDAGWLLSFGAVLGIAVIYPAMLRLLELTDFYYKIKEKRIWKMVESFLVSSAIVLATLPVIFYFYFEVPVYSAVFNLLVIPSMSLLVILAVIAVVCSFAYAAMGNAVMWLAEQILHGYTVLCEWNQHLPGHHILYGRPQIQEIILYYIVLLLLYQALLHRRQARFVVLVSLLIAGQIVWNMPGEQLQVTMLDVGQGDGLHISFPNQEQWLVDGGSSSEKALTKYTYIPYLKSRRIARLDGVFISHSDQDHVLAVEELLEQGYSIRQLILPALQNPDANYQKLCRLASQHHTVVYQMRQHERMQFGDVSVTCVFPTADYETADTNSASLTLDLQYDRFRMLFTGDLQEDGEQEVTQYLQQETKALTVLKVAHHGSKSSSAEFFLRQAVPKYAIISAGRNNRYGHPHREVLKRLKKIQAQVYQTPESGAIILKSNGRKLAVAEYKKQHMGERE